MANGMSRLPVCLTVGGSDACGGAGIQADLRVFHDLDMHGCSAITALTAQNHHAITRIEPVSLAQLDAELHAIFDVYDVQAVKTGMLWDADHIATVSACLDVYHQGKPLVVDPVLVSSSGRTLLDSGALDTLQHTLIQQATLLTPNLDEAAVFLQADVVDASEAAHQLVTDLGCAVLLKGGHDLADTLQDVLFNMQGECHVFSHPKQAWNHVQSHGTGCRLASAIAAYFAKGSSLHDGCSQAIAYVQKDTHA
ncbi:MAG: bifunctional hydroxymethylpyrimidine kinase/phosphomethylpyrimidine kinase [Mariprofundaceae bacterium]|nr:bifunctional hydroxymethylpyrimidine kinase/phosphomethylpyrimidine kinase [Mariprofundaceae bacterium]